MSATARERHDTLVTRQHAAQAEQHCARTNIIGAGWRFVPPPSLPTDDT
jgi:hypothetical protein